MRLRAIACALFYGIAPWRLYEKRCHYEGMSYRAHLWMNLKLAARWASWREDESDREFEIETNQPQENVMDRRWRWLRRWLQRRVAPRRARMIGELITRDLLREGAQGE